MINFKSRLRNNTLLNRLFLYNDSALYLKNGKVTAGRAANTNKSIKKSAEIMQEGNYKDAIKFASKALETASTLLDSCFLRGRYPVEQIQFW